MQRNANRRGAGRRHPEDGGVRAVGAARSQPTTSSARTTQPSRTSSAATSSPTAISEAAERSAACARDRRVPAARAQPESPVTVSRSPALALTAAEELETIRTVLLEAATSTTGERWATCTCPECGKGFRQEISVPDHGARIKAIETLLREGLGRVGEAEVSRLLEPSCSHGRRPGAPAARARRRRALLEPTGRGGDRRARRASPHDAALRLAEHAPRRPTVSTATGCELLGSHQPAH